jgi:phosphoglycolate phosphatase-like HAD superfamily hydrolase
MSPTVLLFDIDGTLITSDGVGRRSIVQAFRDRYRRDDACDFPFDGLTDRQIARRGLAAIGVEPTDGAIHALLGAYLAILKVEIPRVDRTKYRLHPGISHAIAAARRRGHAIGLGTGNVVEGARIKLGAVGLFEQFAFGGFGSDAEDRTEIIRAGAERGARHAGVPLGECRVVVIGDTPKDVAAARDIGAESIGVGTGRYSKGDLITSGATHAFDNLEAPGALEALLG